MLLKIKDDLQPLTDGTLRTTSMRFRLNCTSSENMKVLNDKNQPLTGKNICT